MGVKANGRWNHMHKNVEKSCDMSLKNMGLDYIDLLLIHCMRFAVV